jgi:hypothetical protein
MLDRVGDFLLMAFLAFVVGTLFISVLLAIVGIVTFFAVS